MKTKKLITLTIVIMVTAVAAYGQCNCCVYPGNWVAQPEYAAVPGGISLKKNYLICSGLGVYQIDSQDTTKVVNCATLTSVAINGSILSATGQPTAPNLDLSQRRGYGAPYACALRYPNSLAEVGQFSTVLVKETTTFLLSAPSGTLGYNNNFSTKTVTTLPGGVIVIGTDTLAPLVPGVYQFTQAGWPAPGKKRLTYNENYKMGMTDMVGGFYPEPYVQYFIER